MCIIHHACTDPTAPRNVSVQGAVSFGLQVSWTPPEDSGGRPISEYIIMVVEGITVRRPGNETLYTIVDRSIMENTTYR